MAESRLNKSIKNLQVAWIGQFLNIFAKFIMRRVFVRYISDDYLGLDAVFTNIIGLMNLAELGIGSAVYYALYKPLAEHDEDGVLGVMQLLGKVYRTIAWILLGVGIALMSLLTVIAPEAKDLPYAHLLFAFYIANTCVSYLFSYKGLLASADQKNYIQLSNHYFFIVGLNLTQIFVIYFTRNFVVYAAVQSLFTIAEGISLSLIMDKKYPILKRKDKIILPKAVTNRIWSDVRKIVVGRVGSTIISSTDNLILANVVGLSTTGVYSNYALIKSSLQAIVGQFQSAVSASIGNIAASGEREKELDYFWLLNFITTALYAVTGVCMFNLMQPFIAYWLGGGYLMDYGVLFCLTVIYYFGGIRGIFGTFSMAHGMFDLEAKKTIAEALVNLIVSLILGWKMGLIGVLLGTIISSVCVGLPLELINVGLALPEISKRRYVMELFIYTGAMVITWFISMKLCNLVSMHWYIRLPLGFLISVAVFLAVWWILFGRTKAFRRTVELGKGIAKGNHITTPLN
jgi:O-antigen/teichoic acid export membrane protein